MGFNKRRSDPASALTQEQAFVPRQPAGVVSKWVWLIIPCLFCLVSLMAVLWPTSSSVDKTLPYAGFTPLSSMAGIELAPVLSPDGRYLLYGHSLNLNTDFSIVLQDLQTKANQTLKFAKTASLAGAVWRADQTGVYYQQVDRDKSCEIRLLEFAADMSVQADKLLTRCGARSFHSRLQLTPDQTTLIYSSWPDNSPNIVLMQYELATGRTEQLTTPPPASFGDYQAALSADGRQLAFLRTVSRSKAQVWVLDFPTKNTRLLLDLPQLYPTMLSWSADQQELLLPGDSRGVFALNLATLQLQQRYQTTMPIFEIKQLKDGRYLAAAGDFWHSNTVQRNNPLLNPASSKQVLSHGAGLGTVYIPNPQRAGPAAVVTKRSGDYHLWFYYPDGRQLQLSQSALPDMHQTPLFSPNGEKILLPIDGTLWLFQAGAAPQQLTHNKARAAQAFWGADNSSIYFSQAYQGQLQLMQLLLATGETTVFSTQLQYYQPAADGRYALQRRVGQDQYELLDLRSKQSQLLENLRHSALLNRSLYIRPSGIYFYRRVAGRFEVARYQLATGQLESVTTPSEVESPRFYISPDEQFVYLDDGKKGDIDIGWLQLPAETAALSP